MSKPLLFFISLLFLFSGGVLLYYAMNKSQEVPHGGEQLTPEQIAVALANKTPATGFTLIERSGEYFHSNDLDGEVAIYSFFFATCPGRCLDQNKKVAQLQREYAVKGLRLVSITVDPTKDTPAALTTYANKLAADPEKWHFLTGEMEDIQRIGRDCFGVGIETYTHTESLFAVDRDGHLRGVYEWKTADGFRAAQDMIEVMLAEHPGATAPTLKGVTKAASDAGVVVAAAAIEMEEEREETPEEADDAEEGEEETGFTLIERSGENFYSSDLDGEVCVYSFFFASCPGRCLEQNQKVAQLQREYADQGLYLISITVDPTKDTPSRLTTYANGLAADPEQWLFLTGEMEDIQRIGREHFGVVLETYTHTELFFIIDRDGHTRGACSWHTTEGFQEIHALIETLLAESPGATAGTLHAGAKAASEEAANLAGAVAELEEAQEDAEEGEAE